MTAPERAVPRESALAIEDRLFRALAILRVVVTLNMVVLNAYRRDNYDHPNIGLAVVVALVAWTAAVTFLYDARWRRASWLLAADLAVAMAAMAVTVWVKGPDFNATIPGFWVIGALFAWAIRWHWKGGLIAALLLSLTDMVPRDAIDQGNYGNVFLLMLGGPIVGYMVQSLQNMATERDVALRAAAAADERTRLARAVHDGALQVLAMVQRQGAAAGGEWTQLAALAGQQERSLRSLIRQQDTVTGGGDVDADLCGAIEAVATAHLATTDVATPGRSVSLPSADVETLAAVVKACLDNVVAHAGDGARAWILVEREPDAVVVSVRDDGPGIPDGRLERAAADGRLGVAESIRARMVEAGGEATLTTGSWGTEWELRLPIANPPG